ncbi:uncharacterized protein RJT20DRAFT_94148 [Scheffersomyces xylosifermentans]|uniref:uncharacterized protein n=1 Tax=Scheffersomyces xylosifermentans TaxID=1304137 RepID=UPI00315CAB3F
MSVWPYVRVVLKPFIFIFQLLWRIFWSGLNGRSVFQLVFNFWINFAPVFAWLLIFKNAGIIPKKMRPHIYVKLVMRLEKAVFDIRSSPFSSIFSIVCLIAISWLLYGYVYKIERDWQDDAHHQSIEFFSNLPRKTISSQTSSVNKRIWNILKQKRARPMNCWHASPPVLLALSWYLLNFVYWLKDPINTPKDLLAWFSYVLGHFFAPLLTAIWLYVFHAPGALKLFSYGLGMQNIAGVCTHLVFPNAPPWFIHLYGENKEPNYDMPGYAAGLTRVDIAMGTHVHSAGFHASPIVFGALPSIHSAMAVMVFFFVSYYSRWTILKVFSFCFIVLQWWATIYLDHHWRMDLIVGMFYSIISYTILYCWSRGLRKVDEDFLRARLRFDFKNGSTMGMRVFRNTKLQNFFDPLS